MKKILCMVLIVVAFVAGIIFLDEIKWNDYQLIILLAIVFVATILFSICVYGFIVSAKNKKIKYLENRLEVWNNTAYHVKNAGDEAFNELPIGIILFDDNYEVKFANKYARSIFQNRLIEHPLSSIHNDLYELVKKDEDIERINISIYDKKFDMIFKHDSKLIYLFDETHREEVMKKYRDRTVAIGIVYLDNIEDSFASLSVAEAGELRGKYLGELVSWIGQYNGYLKSFDDDRSLVVVDYKSLISMVNDKFSILDRIRSISSDHNVRVTASIGIACWDVSYEELASYAQNAIELAEKRGGDQVVVNIENEKIQYFGGKTNNSEKSSKVQIRMYAQTIKEHITEAKNVIIMGHTNMDTDSYGGMIGLLRMALLTNENVRMVVDEEKCDAVVKKMIASNSRECVILNKYSIRSEDALDLMNEETLLIVVDTQSPQIAHNPALIDKASKLIVIDHHRQGDKGYEKALVSFVDASASSSVELITEMIPFYGKINITPYEATYMLSGIYVDTNDFTFRVSSNTFEAASYLRELGADMIKIKMLLRESLEKNIELNNALNKAKIVFNKFAIVSLDEIKDRMTIAQISDKVLSIEGVSAAFTIGYVSENVVGVSARSYGDINVQIIMEEMGGGGHFNQAALQKNATIDEVYDELYKLLEREQLQDGEETMKIILTEDVKGKGPKGSIVDVANGYAMFLINSKKAIEATVDNLKQLKEEQEKAKRDEINHYEMVLKLKNEINAKSIEIGVKIGSDGKLFGAVTTKMISDEFENEYGIHIDKKKITLIDEINSLGIYEAIVKLYKDIEAKIEVHVVEK